SPDPKVAPQGAPSPQGDAQRRLARLNPASSLYAYPAGRPGYFTDPLGLDEDCGCKGGNAGATSPNAAGGGSDGGTTSSDDDDNPNVVETTANIIQKILEWEPLPRFPGTSDPALNLLNVRAVPSYEPTNFERETNKLLQEMVNFKWQSILDRAQKGDLTAAEALALMFDAASNADAKTTVKQLLEWLDRGKPGDGRWSEKSWFGLPWPKNAKGDVIRDSDGIPVPTAGDSGFLPQFQDSWKWPSSSNQSAHFLTAVEVDLLYPWYYPMLVREWAKYGHEMEADFSGRSRFYQACLGMGAWYGQWGAVFTEFGPPYFFEDIDSWKWNSIGSGRGNSYADVLLTMQGSDLADMIKNGEIKTSKQIADWIRKHLSDGTTKP
ncbi:MAG TPA: hypothetical protein PL033_20260, partial [Candidatus Brocadiia bacterium]|nr:hypothetical protein [Candidatus Brocadiia bacterium]